MNEIIITTQEELDKLTDFKEQIAIIIKGNIYRLSRNVKNGLYSVSGNATVKYVSDNATVQYVSDNATVQSVSGNATVQSVSGNATVQYVSGNATVQSVSGNATVQYVSGNATVQSVSGNATVKYVSDNATVQSVFDNATVQYVSGNATVKILSDSVTGAASGRAVIILQDCSPKIIISGHATLVNTIAQKHTKESFLNTFIPDDKGFVYLYKSVNSNTRCDFKTGKIKYEGMVTCPDFDPSEDRKCGGGLHLSPLPFMTQKFNIGKILTCRVHKDDFVVYHESIEKVRCRKVEVIGEYNG